LKTGEVVKVLLDWTLPPMELWAIFPIGQHVSAKARAFVTYIEEGLVRDEPQGTSPLDNEAAASHIRR
jgi:hypothetical protein